MHRLPFDCLLFGAHLSFKSPFSHFNLYVHSAQKSHFTSYPFVHNILLLLVFMLESKAHTKNRRMNAANHPFDQLRFFFSQRSRVAHIIRTKLRKKKNLKIMHISIKSEIESESHKKPIK